MRKVRTSRGTRLALAALGVSACQPASENAVIQNESKNSILPMPPLPAVERPMDREALLFAVTRAASAAALNIDDGAEQRKLEGKKFELRIRFGCTTVPEVADSEGRFSVRFDERERTLRLSALPDLRVNDTIVQAIVRNATKDGSSEDESQGKQIEAVEGFWIRRPWLLADGCPVSAPAAVPRVSGDVEITREKMPAVTGEPLKPDNGGTQLTPATFAQRGIGLAEFFTEADPRTGRRDHRAYQATKVLGRDERPSEHGYNLVLSGRLNAEPVSRVISCLPVGADAPPRCVISVEFGRVWMERPGSRQVVAEWGG